MMRRLPRWLFALLTLSGGVEHEPGIAGDANAMIAVVPVAPLACERANARGFGADSRKSVQAGGLCIEMSAGVFVEQFERALRGSIPVAVDRPWVASDSLEMNLQEACDLRGVDGRR